MSAYEAEITLNNEAGLHARPITEFAELANQYDAKIEVSSDSATADGKSVMAMMLLKAAHRSRLVIRAEGPDAAEAVKKLTAFFANLRQREVEYERKAQAAAKQRRSQRKTQAPQPTKKTQDADAPRPEAGAAPEA